MIDYYKIIYDIKRYPDKTAGTPFFVTKII